MGVVAKKIILAQSFFATTHVAMLEKVDYKSSVRIDNNHQL
jgi:hypothetical protein